MDNDARSWMQARAVERRAQRRRDGLGWPEAEPLLAALQAAGIDTVDFGLFGPASFTTFDFAAAAPIIVEWLPRVEDARLKETMVASLAGQRAARGEGARRLIAEYRRPAYVDEHHLRWTIADTLATLAGPADADEIIELLADRDAGTVRQMLCAALSRTKDPRRVHVLVDLIDDDAVAGHAILALRRIGRGTLVAPERMRPRLEALLARPSATEFGRRQARAALKTAGQPG
jgi:HEAT repeat protein